MANLVAFRSAIRASRATPTASRALRRSTAAGLSAADLARTARSNLGLLGICGGAWAIGKIGALGPVHLNLLRRREAAPGDIIGFAGDFPRNPHWRSGPVQIVGYSRRS